MRYQLQFRHYRRSFKRPIRWGTSLAQFRDGLILRLESETGAVGYGEVAPVESFGSESPRKAAMYLRDCCGVIRDETIDALDKKCFPCLHYAIVCARRQISMGQQSLSQNTGQWFPTATLLQSGEGWNRELRLTPGAVYKLKIAGGEDAPEQECEKLVPLLERAREHGCRLRLDANEQLNVEQARAWITRLDPYHDVIEYLEQPLERCLIDESLTLAEAGAIPVAWDESISILDGQPRDSRWERMVFVVKPSLGDLVVIEKYEIPCHSIVISSVFETAVGFAELLTLPYFERIPGLDTQCAFDESDALSYPREANGFCSGWTGMERIWDCLK